MKWSLNTWMSMLMGTVATLVCSVSVTAQEASDCPKLFPDLRCERSGRWEGFHRPIVAPYLFEDPFITTGIYPTYVWHEFPRRSALGGGEVHVAALQARIAVTDRLAFIATKDGRVWKRPDLPLLDDTEGWMNLAGGLKYALIQLPDKNFLLSPMLRVEFASGSSDTFQGHGDGSVIPSVAAAWGLGDLHLIGDLGAQIPFDQGDQSTSLFYHLYADYNVAPFFAPFVQLSGITWVSSGDGKLPVELVNGVKLPLDDVQNVLGTGRFEGADVMNLGSRGVDGQDLWTAAIGAHFSVGEHVTLSVAYERPFSHQKGIFKQRVTTSVGFEF